MWFAIVLSVAAQDIVLEGPVPEAEFFDVEFEVPPGIVEIQVAHVLQSDSADDVLDFGLEDPDGFRGYGGGNEEDAIVGVDAASRSYLPGPIPPGTWKVTVGKARISSANASYRIDIFLRTTATLPPAEDREPYVDAAPLVSEARFYAGDFHVHSEDSGDARPPLDEIAALARDRGLDFVVITDHNTSSHVDRLVPAQRAHPDLLLVPGVEFTTYAGHATGFGATRYVEHRIGHQGRTLSSALADFAAQGALFSINHPALDLGDACIGCAWEHEVPPVGSIHAVEIETGGWAQAGRFFTFDALAFWESLLDQGHHLAALGGSDDHQAGLGNGSPIGDPTTLVFAANLSVPSLRQGILDSRTVVKLQGPDDPMIVLDTSPARAGDTVIASEVTLTATVTNGVGASFRFVENALGVDLPVPITTDPQTFTLVRTPSADGRQRVRAEVLVDDGGELVPRTLTSYVWLQAAPPPDGCTCGGGGAAPFVFVLVLVALRRLR